MKVLRAILLLVCVEPLVGFSLCPNLSPLSGYSCSYASSSSLQMGLGSFVKRKLGGLKGGKDNKEPAKPTRTKKATARKSRKSRPSKASTSKPKQNTAAQSTVKKPVRKREVPVGSNVPPDDRNDGIKIPVHESVTDRIKRTQAGQMTEAEKQAFLMTSLGQKPDVKSQVNNNATPLPRDSILKQVMTGKKDITPEMMSDVEKQKEEYLKLVTNPDRFKGFEAASGKKASTATESPDATAAAENPIDTSSTAQQHRQNDLGSRLEAAAIAQENQQRELRKQVEAQRQETLRRNQEIAEQRQLEIARQEEIALKKRRELEAKKAAEAKERARIEAQKKAELERKQDEYWKKQLEKEKQMKVENIVEEFEEKDGPEFVEPIEAKENIEATQLEPEPEAAVEEVLSAPVPAPPKVNTFVERQAARRKLLEKQQEEHIAKLKALNSPLPSGPPKGLVPAPVATPTPGAEGLRRSEEKSVPVYNDVRATTESQVAQPQHDLPSSTVANPVAAPAPRLDLKNLVGQSQRQGTASAPSQPAPQPIQQPAGRADLKTLMNQRAKMDAEKQPAGRADLKTLMNQRAKMDAEEKFEGDDVPPSNLKPHLPVDLGSLMKKRAEEDKKKNASETKTSSSNGFLGRVFGGGNKERREPPPPAVEEFEEEPEMVPAAAQRRPIRQQLNLEDYDDEDSADFEEAWNGRSIKDVVDTKTASLSDEDKSKMFGIDMSKFSP